MAAPCDRCCPSVRRSRAGGCSGLVIQCLVDGPPRPFHNHVVCLPQALHQVRGCDLGHQLAADFELLVGRPWERPTIWRDEDWELQPVRGMPACRPRTRPRPRCQRCRGHDRSHYHRQTILPPIGRLALGSPRRCSRCNWHAGVTYEPVFGPPEPHFWGSRWRIIQHLRSLGARCTYVKTRFRNGRWWMHGRGC
jgi:hypothetical protein